MFNWLKFSNNFQKIQCKFENILHEDLGAKDTEIQKMKSVFSISNDESLIRGLAVELPENEDERIMSLFSRLSLFFEIGVFCETVNSNENKSSKKIRNPLSQAQVVFMYGQFKTLPESNKIHLPVVGPSRTLRSQQDHLWKELSIYKWIRGERMTSLLVQLNDKYSFILFSKFADPWLRIHFEKIHNEILKA